MNRTEWEFEYTAAKLGDAAVAQRDFRQSRIEFWENKKSLVMQKIKDSGITVTESIADLLYAQSAKIGNTFGQRGAHITIDATLQEDLTECVEKIRHHRDLRDQYAAWAQVLTANPESRLRLKLNDWMFFFGK